MVWLGELLLDEEAGPGDNTWMGRQNGKGLERSKYAKLAGYRYPQFLFDLGGMRH